VGQNEPVPFLLLIEDDDAIRTGLELALTRQGHRVATAASGEDGLKLFKEQRPDLIVLDVMLPGIDGFEVCRRIRRTDQLPIILLTARSDDIDVVVGLESGADDYVVKPVQGRVLDARIRAVLRRTHRGADDVRLRAGSLELDLRSRRATLDGRELALTPKEFDLLALLASDPGAVVSRDHMLREVWNTEWFGPTKTIDVHVASLRKKLGDPRWIETVRGVGLRLAPQP